MKTPVNDSKRLKSTCSVFRKGRRNDNAGWHKRGLKDLFHTTKLITGLLFVDSIESLREELARVESNVIQTTGNWSTGQIFYHLAATFEGSVDGLPSGYPMVARIVIRPFRWVVTRFKFPPWLPIPAAIRYKLEPPIDVDVVEQYNRLLLAIERFDSHEGEYPPHPVLGPLSKQEWVGFHLRHCQHHLAFIQTERKRLGIFERKRPCVCDYLFGIESITYTRQMCWSQPGCFLSYTGNAQRMANFSIRTKSMLFAITYLMFALSCDTLLVWYLGSMAFGTLKLY